MFVKTILTAVYNISKVLFDFVIYYKSKDYLFIKEKNKTLVILLNGGSLIQYQRSDNEKVMCFNNMVSSDVFNIIKPEYYLVMDRSFWDNNVNPEYISQCNTIINNLNNNVDWNMYLFVPNRVKNMEKRIVNKNIRIVYYTVNHLKSSIKYLDFFFLRRNLAIYMPYNVLIPALIVGINMNYRKIEFWGGEHSWHEYIRIIDNLLYMSPSYNKTNSEKDYIQVKNYDGTSKSVGDFFYWLAVIFNSYPKIKEYADSMNVQIINRSSESWIDTFEKA